MLLLIVDLDSGGEHELLDGDGLEGGVGVAGGGGGVGPNRQLLQLQVEAHVHPHEVDCHRDQDQRQVLRVHRPHRHQAMYLVFTENFCTFPHNPSTAKILCPQKITATISIESTFTTGTGTIDVQLALYSLQRQMGKNFYTNCGCLGVLVQLTTTLI